MNHMPHLDLSDVREQSRKLAEQRREARRDRKRYGEQKAQKESDYRKRLWSAFATKRAEGTPVNASEIYAKAEAADLAMERDMADVLVKDCDARIDELEADRAQLRQIGEWSMRLEGLPQPDWRDKEQAAA